MSCDEKQLKVIVRCNDFEWPYKIGTFLGFDASLHNMPMVDFDGVVNGVMGIIMPYSPELENLLKNMSHEEQWKFLVNLIQGVRATDKYYEDYRTQKY